MSDGFTDFEPLLAQPLPVNPWTVTDDGGRAFVPDVDLLEGLLAVALRDGHVSQSGRLPKALDSWVAAELRRAGFAPDEVWPRATQPRVLPREVAGLLDRLPADLATRVQQLLLKHRSVAPAAAQVLGRAYVKQVDVVVAQWSRGPEVLVSTKCMVSSFGKNLANRFEESYGDAQNLRGRYPLASLGFLYLMRSTVLAEPGSFERAVDMLRRLRESHRPGEPLYDATGLVLVEWDGDRSTGVRVVLEEVPHELRCENFFAPLIERVLARTPVTLHVPVRERRERRPLHLTEEAEQPP